MFVFNCTFIIFTYIAFLIKYLIIKIFNKRFYFIKTLKYF